MQVIWVRFLSVILIVTYLSWDKYIFHKNLFHSKNISFYGYNLYIYLQKVMISHNAKDHSIKNSEVHVLGI